MITLHEVSAIMQKMAAMSNYITQLNQLLPEVVQLFEKLDDLNQDMALDQDRMTAKIRTVEMLGEILRTHVYQLSNNAKVDKLTRHL
ncbi:MAG: hypothetical protein JSV52_00850 [Candidatus Zixiibacteriota bacterium]|nr:MAG: hypothetical protein JSV52_00850 [candidate division Zixibacteria bacterium]